MYEQKINKEIFIVSEPSIDLFNYLDEHNIEKDCVISKDNNDASFETVTPNCLIGNGNCINLMSFVGDNSVDLILTDPPYNLGEFMHRRNTNLVKMRENQFAYAGWDNLSQTDWEVEMEHFFKESSRVLRKGGALLLFMSLIKIETIIKIATKYKFYYKTTGVWHKTNPMPRNMNIHFINSTEAWVYFINNNTSGVFNNKGKIQHDFIETSLTSSLEKKFGKHPTQKPVKLMSHFINLLTNENNVVLDPFMGSGTTGVAARKSNRKFIGIELSQEYFQISKERIKNE